MCLGRININIQEKKWWNKRKLAYNGKHTRGWINNEDKSSPTVLTKSLILACSIDVYEGRDVMSMDISNVFIQTDMPEKKKRWEGHNGNTRQNCQLVGRIYSVYVLTYGCCGNRSENCLCQIRQSNLWNNQGLTLVTLKGSCWFGGNRIIHDSVQNRKKDNSIQ